MRKLIRRALKSLDRLNHERLHNLVQELVKDNEQLEMVLSSIPVGVLVTGPDHRVIVINNPARRMLPLSCSDPVDQSAWEVIASADLSNFVRASLESDRGAPMRDFPIRHRDRDLILSCGILPLVNRGRIMGSLLYIEDVTDVRAEEARFKRAEGLASLTTMAAGVAHEIKNPLASMSIHLQLMRRQMHGEYASPEELQESLEILEEETERLNNIVSDYLFAVRPQDSRPLPADINALITELVQFLRYEMEDAHVRVLALLDKSIPSIPLDEGAMKRALLNLIKNAITAMPEGGELRLQTRRDGDNVLIEVSDTGVGIPEELHGKIFEPYFTTRDTGSGLGLTVVYKVVREHGGDLHMDSQPGRGTTFRISIPVPQSERKLLSGGDS
ncbi:MAG: PAS domain-containing protein [Spirochaetaceae bacterium]|nr:PAS domain-containing protein [Spirochaetaceae bacterium]